MKNHFLDELTTMFEDDGERALRFIGLVYSHQFQGAYDMLVESNGCCSLDDFEGVLNLINPEFIPMAQQVNIHTKCNQNAIKEITLEKTVKVGMSCKIHSSMGFLGIEEGEIKVVEILKGEEVDPPELDMWKDLFNMTDPDQVAEFKRDYEDVHWIVFHYTSGKPYVRHFLPLWLFADHTTIY